MTTLVHRKKTNLMLRAEARVQAPLERYLMDSLHGRPVSDGSMTTMAEELDISQATLGYWMLRLGIRSGQVAVVPGDRVYAVARDGSERLLLEVT